MGMGAVACGGNGDENGTLPPGSGEETTLPPEDVEETTPPPEDGNGAPTPALPKPGVWTALTEFGELGLTVSPDSTGIAEISLVFGEFLCLGILSGPVSVSVENPSLWPIIDGQFTVQFIVDNPQFYWEVVIVGEFDETGTYASGAWEIDICSGTWESSY
jgi:hypothetical protein